MHPTSSRQVLSVAKTASFLVSDLKNIRYLSGIPLTSGLLLITEKRMLLFVDARYRYEAEMRCRKGITVRDIADFAKYAADVRACGVESETLTVQKKVLLKKNMPSTKLVQTLGVIAEFRRSKDADELQIMRRAERMTREILRRVPSALRRGTSEEKLARQLAIWALEMGADGLAFDPIVAFGTHTCSPHHAPTSRSLQKGHLVQVDVGVKLKGYCSDLSRVYFTGLATPAQRKVYETLVEAQEAAMQLARPGATNHELDAAARTVLRREGMESAFTHALGHGLGLEIHEGVSLSLKSRRETLRKGEVITIEPGVYFPGKFGMRIEDQCFVA